MSPTLRHCRLCLQFSSTSAQSADWVFSFHFKCTIHRLGLQFSSQVQFLLGSVLSADWVFSFHLKCTIYRLGLQFSSQVQFSLGSALFVDWCQELIWHQFGTMHHGADNNALGCWHQLPFIILVDTCSLTHVHDYLYKLIWFARHTIINLLKIKEEFSLQSKVWGREINYHGFRCHCGKPLYPVENDKQKELMNWMFYVKLLRFYLYANGMSSCN